MTLIFALRTLPPPDQAVKLLTLLLISEKKNTEIAKGGPPRIICKKKVIDLEFCLDGSTITHERMSLDMKRGVTACRRKKSPRQERWWHYW